MKFKIIYLLKILSLYICMCIKIDNNLYMIWIFDILIMVVILIIVFFYIFIYDFYDNFLLCIVVE